MGSGTCFAILRTSGRGRGRQAGEEGGGAKEDGEEGEDNYQESEKKRKRKKLTFTDKQGEKTLDKIDNINIQEFDTEAVIDPLFK